MPTMGKKAMVVSEQKLATEAGIAILKAGGNAIDAAVAVGYALAVVDPCCGNIGGGGFMTLHLANHKNTFIDFREKAPFAATPNMFAKQKSTEGYLSVAVPGTVLGFDYALKKYGTFSSEKVMHPAIQLAEKGYILTEGDVKLLKEETQDFKKQSNVAAIFLKNHEPYQVGDKLVQKELAKTLKQIETFGSGIFYHGKLAKKIVRASQQNGGVLTLNDFSHYSVEERNPIICSYHHYQIISAPPPSSGGVSLCESLNILENFPLKKLGSSSIKSLQYTIEAMRYAFYDRNNQLGDPEFVKNPLNQLLSKQYAKKISTQILKKGRTPSEELKSSLPKKEGMHTTHFSVIDKWGNAVSVTYTLNSFFGAKVIARDTGFFLNDEMDDFATQKNGPNQFGLMESQKNAIEPGKRPLSSMTPTIILHNNQVYMLAGSSGGPKIITATLLTLLNVIDYKMNIQDAVNAKRFHHQWLPDVVYTEPNTFSKEITTQLEKNGYQLKELKPWGAVEAICVNPKTHLLYGANDNIRRTAGKALGLN